mmetsp:Transcript_73846/g.142811  ORF Transcript_73846/g.142811 Transcript_73846/m.142811 type:complete len:262 (-) Transcript_73846:221-1006(-)
MRWHCCGATHQLSVISFMGRNSSRAINTVCIRSARQGSHCTNRRISASLHSDDQSLRSRCGPDTRHVPNSRMLKTGCLHLQHLKIHSCTAGKQLFRRKVICGYESIPHCGCTLSGGTTKQQIHSYTPSLHANKGIDLLTLRAAANRCLANSSCTRLQANCSMTLARSCFPERLAISAGRSPCHRSPASAPYCNRQLTRSQVRSSATCSGTCKRHPSLNSEICPSLSDSMRVCKADAPQRLRAVAVPPWLRSTAITDARQPI